MAEKDVEVVEAEVIEQSIERIEYVPAVINAETYLAARKSWLADRLRPYRDMDDEAICAMDAKEAKICREDLNRIIKEVEDERKAIKRAYSEPLDKFEAAVKELLEPAREGSARLKQYLDDQREIQRDMRRRGLEATYNDYAPALVPVVPFERVLEINPKWLNKSYSAAKAATELEEAVDGIARDWEVLKRQASLMKFYDEAEAVFFRTLDLNAAIAHNDEREAEAQRIAQLKADVERNRAAQTVEEAAPAEEAVAEDTAEEPSAVAVDMREPYLIRIRLSEFEKRRLIGFIKQENIGTDRVIAKERKNG